MIVGSGGRFRFLPGLGFFRGLRLLRREREAVMGLPHVVVIEEDAPAATTTYVAFASHPTALFLDVRTVALWLARIVNPTFGRSLRLVAVTHPSVPFFVSISQLMIRARP